MKRVLLIITFSLLSRNNYCALAASADSKSTLATLEQAGHRTNPFLEENHQRRKRLQRVRSSSAPATPTEGSLHFSPPLKRTENHQDLRTLEADEMNSDQDNDGTDEELGEVFDQDVPNGQRVVVSPEYTAPPLEITSQLGELFTAGNRVAAYNARTRIIPAATLPLIAWAGSKTNWAKELFPGLFPRSGTSTVIACSLAVLAGGAGLWALRDRIAAAIHIQEAFRQMELSQRELAAMAQQIEQLRNGQLQFKNQQEAMQKLLQETRTNAANARQGLEGLEESVKALVAQIKGDLGKAVHVREVVALKERVTDLEAVLTQISLNQLNQADAQGPDLDVMARQAQELAQAAQRFARTDDQQANQAFANAAVTEAKKKKKRFGLW